MKIEYRNGRFYFIFTPYSDTKVDPPIRQQVAGLLEELRPLVGEMGKKLSIASSPEVDNKVIRFAKQLGIEVKLTGQFARYFVSYRHLNNDIDPWKSLESGIWEAYPISGVNGYVRQRLESLKSANHNFRYMATIEQFTGTHKYPVKVSADTLYSHSNSAARETGSTRSK